MTPTSSLIEARLARQRCALRLRSRPTVLRCVVVCCLYDTAFEDLSMQVEAKLRQVHQCFAGWPQFDWALLVVDDDGRHEAEIRAAFERVQRSLACPESACRRLSLPSVVDIDLSIQRDRKGLALLRGFQSLISEGWELFLYVNLNLKVHFSQAALLIERVLQSQKPVFGTRAFSEGGGVYGAGGLGRLKSVVYNQILACLLPPLAGFMDTNAPMKLLPRAALKHLLRVARVEDVSFDSEWCLALLEGGFDIETQGVVWQQRAGSQPPWDAVLRVLASVFKQRQRWLRGHYRGFKGHELGSPCDSK